MSPTRRRKNDLFAFVKKNSIQHTFSGVKPYLARLVICGKDLQEVADELREVILPSEEGIHLHIMYVKTQTHSTLHVIRLTLEKDGNADKLLDFTSLLIRVARSREAGHVQQ